MSRIEPVVYEGSNGKPVTIRSASPADSEALMSIAHEFISEGKYNVTEPDEMVASPDMDRGWIQKHLSPAGYILLLAEVDGEVIGMLSFQNGARRRIAHRGSFHVWVVRNWMNYGIDRALVETLLDWAKDNPLIEKVGVEVFATHGRALKLFHGLGFEEEGRRPNAIKFGPKEYADTYLLYKMTPTPSGVFSGSQSSGEN